MAYTTIGNTVVEWNEHEPLIFSLSEETGSKDDRRPTTVKFDLSSLREGFEEEFLLNLKNLLMDRRHRIALITVKTEFQNLVLVFRKVIDHGVFSTKINVIDETFLLAINTITEQLSSVCLETLRRVFNSNPHSTLFAQGIRSEDFPVNYDKKGTLGKISDRILAKALSRSACVEILKLSEEAYGDCAMDIGLLCFINVAFSVYARPDSYRRIRVNEVAPIIETGV